MAAIDEEIVVVDSRRKRGQLSAEVSLLLPGAVYQILTPAAPHLNLKKKQVWKRHFKICTFNGKERFVVISAPGQSSDPKGGSFHSWKWFTLSFFKSSLKERGDK